MTATYPTPDESRAKILEAFDATRALIGGTEWELDGQSYGLCPLPDGTEGAEYFRQEGTKVASDSAAMAKRIAALWESRGYAGVTLKPFPDGVGFEVTYPKDDNRVFLQVGITDRSATISMSGGCVRGDAGDLDNALVE